MASPELFNFLKYEERKIDLDANGESFQTSRRTSISKSSGSKRRKSTSAFRD